MSPRANKRRTGGLITEWSLTVVQPDCINQGLDFNRDVCPVSLTEMHLPGTDFIFCGNASWRRHVTERSCNTDRLYALSSALLTRIRWHYIQLLDSYCYDYVLDNSVIGKCAFSSVLWFRLALIIGRIMWKHGHYRSPNVSYRTYIVIECVTVKVTVWIKLRWAIHCTKQLVLYE